MICLFNCHRQLNKTGFKSQKRQKNGCRRLVYKLWKEVYRYGRKIVKVLNEMAEYLTIAQRKKIQQVIIDAFAENQADKTDISNEVFLKLFLDAKRVEGCSDRTIIFYDELQSIRATDIDKIRFEEICRPHLFAYYKLISQMRCKGSNGYYDYVKDILEKEKLFMNQGTQEFVPRGMGAGATV